MENNYNYLIEKRIEVLNALKPYCDVFGIKNYDYIIDTKIGNERLKLNNTLIGCSGNSISAIIDEFIGYIFVNIFCKNRHLGAFKTQTLNEVKRYWKKGEA